jgi:hypothetical protein
LNWTPLVTVILEQKHYEENRDLIRQILSSNDISLSGIFSGLEEKFSVGLFIKDFKIFGEPLAIELVLSFFRDRHCLLQESYFPVAGASFELGIVLAMSCKTLPAPSSILKLWIDACRASNLPVHSFEEEIDYLSFYDESQTVPISNLSFPILNEYISADDLFCKFTIWCLQLSHAVKDIIRRWWAQLYLILNKHNPNLYQTVQMHSMIKNFVRKIV